MSQTPKGSDATKSAAKAAGFVMGMIFLSRFIGFIREAIIAHTFGRTGQTDAFYLAFTIPDIMYYLLVGGALSSAFIPVFTEYLAKDREREGWEAASTFINVVLVLLVSFTILGIIFAPGLSHLIAYSYADEKRKLLVELMRFMFPAVFCTATAGLQMGILNSYRHFFAPTFGPIVYNVGIILGAVLLGTRFGVKGVAAGVVFGAMCSVLTQFTFVLGRNKGYRLIIDLKNPGYRRMIGLMLPTLLGLALTQLNLVINQNFASSLAAGSITALRYADRLMQLPLGIFAMGISQAFFPTFIRQVAKDEMSDFKETFSLGLRAIFLITVPAAIGLIVLREPIVALLFQRGEFGPEDTNATAYALMFYSLGLVAASGEQVLTRTFYSLRDTSTPVKTGALRVLLIFVLNTLFLRFTDLAHGGLALSFSIGVTVNICLLLYLLSRRVNGIGMKRLLVTLVKALTAGIVMGIVVYSISAGVSSMMDTSGGMGLILQVALSIAGGAIVYAGIGIALRMEETGLMLVLIRKKLSHRRIST